MSSPIHHARDLDAALVYAPPWARGAERAAPKKPVVAAVERPPWNWLTDDADDAFGGDRAMADLQRQLALNPDKVPEPPMHSAPSVWPFVLRLCAVSGVAALVAWGLVALPGTKKTASEVAQADVPPPPPPIASNRVKLVEVRTATALPPVVQDRFEAQDAPAPPAENPPAPIPQPPAAESASPPLALGGDEIATLIKRGKDFLMNGDLASARLLLRRGADAGSAEAALALGASFDPLVIAQLGAIGAEFDVARARQWYQKAVALGSSDASQQLAKLAQSHP
jgi:hypothetical protein